MIFPLAPGRFIAATKALLAVVLWNCSGCTEAPGPESDADRSVVVYVSADQQFAAPVLAAFEDATGIAVRPLYDTEATKTTGLAQRIRREADRPRADVFWSSEPFAVEALAAEGLLAPTDHPALADHPEAWRRDDDRWFAFGGRARVIAYRPDRISESELPRHWEALADPRWAGEVVMADPRFGTTRGHLASLAGGWGDRRFEAWIQGLRRNEVRLLPGGNAATVDAVVRGEALLGLTDTDDVIAARRRGAVVGATLPRHEDAGVPSGGTLLIPNAVGRITNGPSPDSAAELVAWLASAEVERRLRSSASRNQPIAHPTVLDEVEVDDSERLDEGEPWAVDIQSTAGIADATIDRAMQILSDSESPGSDR